MSLLSKDDFLAQLTPNVTRDVEDDCAICYEEVSSATETVCQHIFCLECLSTWLQSSATCPACRRELYQPEEEVDDHEDSEDESGHESDDDSGDEVDRQAAADLAARSGPDDDFVPMILGYENIDFSMFSSDYGFCGYSQSGLVEAVQDWLEILKPDGVYKFRNQQTNMVYVEDKICDYLEQIILWLKIDSQDGRYTLEEVCREDWALVCVSVHDSIYRHKGRVKKADAFRSDIIREWEERQQRADRVPPEYAKHILNERGPGPFQSFKEQFDHLLDIVLDYSKDRYRPGVTWPENAAPLKGVHIDMYELFDCVKEFEAFEERNDFDLSSNLDRRIAFPAHDESVCFWTLMHMKKAALLRIKPDPPPNAEEETIARDDWCARPWAIVDELIEDICMVLESASRRYGEEMKVSDFIDSLWHTMRRDNDANPLRIYLSVDAELDLGWATNRRFPSYGAAYQGTSTFENDMGRLFAYMAYVLTRQYDREQAALQELNRIAYEGGSIQQGVERPSVMEPDEQLSLNDDAAQ